MGILFTNNAEGTLTAGVDSGDTTNMTLTAGDGVLFPTVVLASGNYFYVTLVDSSGNREIIQVTEHQAGTDVFQTFVRAQDDTDAIAFSIGDKVQLRLPKVILEEYRDDINTNTVGVAANLAAIGTNDTDIAALQARDTADEQVLYAPSGLTMYIYNAAGEIPTGWSAHSGPADCLLAIAGGSQAYNVAGENLAGSWTPTVHAHTGPSHVHTMSTHVHTGPSHTHTGPSHSHTGPSHNHQWYDYIGSALVDSWAANGITKARWGANRIGTTVGPMASVSNADNQSVDTKDMYTILGGTGVTGSGGTGVTGASGTGDSGATDPGDTNASGTANTGTGSAPATDRPYAAVGLLIERD
jgi:hypothetical protein